MIWSSMPSDQTPVAQFTAQLARLSQQIEINATDSGSELGLEECRQQLALLQSGVVEINDLIARTRREVADMILISPAQIAPLNAASDELESIVGAAEQAADGIIQATEVTHASSVRLLAMPDMPAGAKDELGQIQRSANDILTACSFQDLTGQRIRKVVQALTSVEQRVMLLINLKRSTDGTQTASPSHSPSNDADRTTTDEMRQADVDALFDR